MDKIILILKFEFLFKNKQTIFVTIYNDKKSDKSEKGVKII